MPELLLEVGFEEMPAPWLPGLTEQLRKHFEEIAAREHLSPRDLATFSTPRRLVLRADVQERQEDREDKVWGPSLKVARDASGSWTGAAQGFARKNSVRPEDLQQAAKDPGAPDDLYLLYLRKTPGRPATDVLPGVLAATLRALAFPKRMSWDAWLDDGKGAFPFGRPIRWLVTLLGGAVVPFAIRALEHGGAGEVIVRSGDKTYGHRFLPPAAAGRPIAVRSFEDLRARLAEHFVLVDPREREARIRQGLEGAGRVQDDHGLVAEWCQLVEYPTVLTGRVPEEFQKLPRAVLETVLVHHQKYVPLGSGDRVESFAALTNTDGASAAEIVRNMERVVVARLRDAAFFFAEDMRRPLDERVDDLAGVTFHQQLGDYKQKAERMVGLVKAVGSGRLSPDESDLATQAARLAKADLGTLMVREFPELQGVMGSLYLEAQGGVRGEVIQAVRWHYHPVAIEAKAPPAGLLSGSEGTVFAAVSLADKLDSLAGYFGLGLAPSGSSDPFGLRRAAQGVVRILLDFWMPAAEEGRADLRRLIRVALEPYGFKKRPTEEIAHDLELFLLDRLRYVLASRGFSPDEVEAALAAREPDALDDPHEAWRRVRALHHVRSEAAEDFDHLAVAFKRAKNIKADQAVPTVDAGLLKETAERELFDALTRLRDVDGGYEVRLRSLAGLRGPVDRFFDDVLVMAEDPALRANRLGLLSQALSLFYRIADISKLGGSH